MKKIIITCFAMLWMFSVHAQKDSDVLLDVGGIPVTVGEFRYIYEKNNGDNADYSKKSIMEYLDLYKKFKLKVKKAKDLKIDTITSLKQELEGYRTQLATSYIYDKDVLEKVVRDIYDRKKWDVRARHIFAKKKKSKATDSKAALQKIQDANKALKLGASFESIAKQFSEDNNTASKGGDLGYLTATLPELFLNVENTIYSLSKGERSDIVESDLGYHIIEVTGKRPARGSMQVAHILLKEVPKGQNLKKKADSIYNALQKGANWKEMVAVHTQDGQTKGTKGVLPEMFISMYAKEFEDAAFALKKDGDISKPVKTNIGYHIIKRLEKKPMPSFEEFYKNEKARVKRRKRYLIAEKKYLQELRKKGKYTENVVAIKEFTSSLDDSFYSFQWEPKANISKKDIMTIGGRKYTMKDFATYCKKNMRKRGALGKGYPLDKGVRELFDGFKKDNTLNYAIAEVEKNHPDFKSLMREYEEGILLFEITKQKVWDKANQDTVGLAKFFKSKQDDYQWNNRAKIIKYTVTQAGEPSIQKMIGDVKKLSPKQMLEKYNKKDRKVISFVEDTIEEGSRKSRGIRFEDGHVSSVKALQHGNHSHGAEFYTVTEILPPMPKKLEEVRGFVVADYQDVLESKWIDALTKEYKIDIKNKVLNALIKK